jgi:large subunit ribosomal protein L19
MQSVIQKIEEKYKKPQVVDVRSGDTVKVHQKIREGNKERVQVFQGLVIRTDRKGSHTSKITVRRIASGIGVEKSFLIHSPLVTKIEVTKRSKVRRNYLTYMRQRTGKSARLTGVDFDRDKVNVIDEVEVIDEPRVEVEAEAKTTPEEVTPIAEIPEAEPVTVEPPVVDATAVDEPKATS